MSRMSSFMIASALATLSLMPNCRADNSPILRDCSFGPPPGAPPFIVIDPDTVELSGATLNVRNGVLSVLPSQTELVLTASESGDPGDKAGHDQLFATVSTPGQPTQGFSGTGTGFVILGIPLNIQNVGQVFTITWNASFDNGVRLCPSTAGPFPPPYNPTEIPFIVTVVPGAQNGQ